jgi:hypothetical protein
MREVSHLAICQTNTKTIPIDIFTNAARVTRKIGAENHHCYSTSQPILFHHFAPLFPGRRSSPHLDSTLHKARKEFGRQRVPRDG